jgi:hypothetical protein
MTGTTAREVAIRVTLPTGIGGVLGNQYHHQQKKREE